MITIVAVIILCVPVFYAFYCINKWFDLFGSEVDKFKDKFK